MYLVYIETRRFFVSRRFPLLEIFQTNLKSPPPKKKRAEKKFKAYFIRISAQQKKIPPIILWYFFVVSNAFPKIM